MGIDLTSKAMYVFTGSKASQIIITTLQSILVILNIGGNSLVCAVIVKNQDMRYVCLEKKKNICVRVDKYLSRIMSLSFSCWYLKDIDTVNRLYCSLVRHLLEYSCETWNPHTKCNIDKLEAAQRRATRWITRSDDDYDTRLSKRK